MSARALMVAGTASHVGKSWMATAICRWMARQGWRVAPFKAQNMSNNSYPCVSGGEIGRAQVAQAEACFLEPEPDMNPILLKPNSDTGSQVVLNGRVWKTLPAREYYSHFPYLLEQVMDAYERLSARHDFVVMEGAGSITELNLRQTDLVNMGLATRLNVPVMLTADIDRGGVFAAVAGSFALLEENERSLVRSFAINRFRGDPSLFENGVQILQERTGKPCLGVFPYLRDALLDPEDGVAFEGSGGADSDIAIIALPHISNLSDFRLIPAARRISQPVDGLFHCVIIPGTKNTLGDLAWLRQTGSGRLDRRISTSPAPLSSASAAVTRSWESGSMIRSKWNRARAAPRASDCCRCAPYWSRKVTRRVSATTPSGIEFGAYEIHLGFTARQPAVAPFAILNDGASDGVRMPRLAGTYLHGALEDPRVLGELLGRSIAPVTPREQTYESLADWFEANVDRKRFEELYLCS